MSGTVSTCFEAIHNNQFRGLYERLLSITSTKVTPSHSLTVGLLSFLYSYCQRRVLGSRSLLVVYIFTSTKSPRGPPWNEGHRPKVHHETSVLEVPAQEQHEHSFFSSSTDTFITGSLYTVRGYRTSPGAPDLRARLGWLQGSTQNGM